MGADWISLGLGVVQELHGAMATGSNGVSVESPAVSYHAGDAPAQGDERTIPAIVVTVEEVLAGGGIISMASPCLGCNATISLTGLFATGGPNPPVVANLQFWCSDQSGNWGTSDHESELLFKADAMPTPLCTPEDPQVEFRCRLELKIPTFDNVIVHFPVYVNQIGFLRFGDPQFEYGKCDVYPWGTGLAVVYNAQKHGG